MNLILNEIICNNNVLLDPTNESEVSKIIVQTKKGAARGRDGETVKNLLIFKVYIIEILTVPMN